MPSWMENKKSKVKTEEAAIETTPTQIVAPAAVASVTDEMENITESDTCSL